MRVIRDIASGSHSRWGGVLAIGNFDGVHRGHQAVLSEAIKVAEALDVPAGAMTFEPHPRSFFQPDKLLFRLTPEPMKLRLFEALGLEEAVVVPFNAALAAQPARGFVREFLVEGLGVSHVVTGSDFHFGKGRDGNPDVLRRLGDELGFKVTIVAPEGDDGEIFSSTRARTSLRQGDPRGAAEILGYWWRVAGTVSGGDKRGHGLGFPTANIPAPEGFALKHGIYAVRVHVHGSRFGGAAYFGTRPTFDDGAPVIETFLFEYSGSLYGEPVELEFVEFLRDDAKFDEPGALVTQMHADCDTARAVLAELESNDPIAGFPLARLLHE